MSSWSPVPLARFGNRSRHERERMISQCFFVDYQIRPLRQSSSSPTSSVSELATSRASGGQAPRAAAAVAAPCCLLDCSHASKRRVVHPTAENLLPTGSENRGQLWRTGWDLEAERIEPPEDNGMIGWCVSGAPFHDIGSGRVIEYV